ncbi:MAG: hypothetical protein Q9201_002473 [Fulgogasparrea decipioides]
MAIRSPYPVPAAIGPLFRREEKMAKMPSHGTRMRVSSKSGAEQTTGKQHKLSGNDSATVQTGDRARAVMAIQLVAKVDPTTSESAFPAYSRSATVASLGQLPELSVPDTSSTSLLSLAATDSADDLGSWEGPHTVHGEIPRAMKPDGHDTIGLTSDPLSLEPWGKTRPESDSCRCLLDSISFLERMASRSASRENRIDQLLAEVRNCLETLAILMACERCAARVEHNTLLAMAARQISVICGKMANCYKAMYLCGLGDTKKSSQQKPELYSSADSVDISVSTYRVNRRERLHLLENLVTLQIVEFQQHLNTIKTRHCNQPNQGQVEALIEAENHVKLAKIAISSIH